MPKSPFYIDPGFDYTRGLKGLQAGLEFKQLRIEREKARAAKETEKVEELERKRKASTAALMAYNSGNIDKIAETIITYPETGEYLGKLYDRQRGYDKEDYSNNLEKLMTEIETTGTLTELVPPLYDPKAKEGLSGIEGAYPGEYDPSKPSQKPTNKIDIIRSIYAKDKEKGKQMIEYEFAKSNPKKYKAWKDIYHPEEKKVAPTDLKKSINERQALLDSGVPEDDPRIKAYDNKLWPDKSDKEKKISPHLRLMNERDTLIGELFDLGMSQEEIQNHPDVMGFNNKILGDLNKKYSPTTLKKSIEERQEFIEAGEDPKGPIIKAYDNYIAGVDIDIEDLTQEEIDFWGVWTYVTGKMPSVGRGKQATKIRAAILKSAAAYGLGLGNLGFDKDPKRTPSEAAFQAVGTQADTKSIQGALGYLEKQIGAMGSFIQNMDAQIIRFKEIAKELNLFDVRLFNIPRRLWRSKIIGHANQAKFDLYLTEIEAEIGKLAQGSPQSIAELSTGAQEKWDRIHDKNLGFDDIVELLSETSHAAKLRMRSVNDQLNRTREKMRTRKYPGTEVIINTQEEYLEFKKNNPSGTLYIDSETGQPARLP